MLLDIQETRVDDVAVLQLTGKLALGRESQRIEALADEFVTQGQKKVVFDITGVNYIDSAGIGMLAMTAGKLREIGGKLVLVSDADGRTTQLLKLTQINSIVPLCPSMDEALAALA